MVNSKTKKLSRHLAQSFSKFCFKFFTTKTPRLKPFANLIMSTTTNGSTKHTHTDVRPVSDEGTPLLQEQKRHSTFSNRQKRSIIMTAALASTFSPISANIYYPALNSIATDLHMSASLINLTIMTYMVSLLPPWQKSGRTAMMKS